MEKKKDALIRTFWQRLTYGDQPLADGTMALMDRTPPRARLDVFWSRWQCAGLVWHT
jgi:hypothetical protein